MIKNNQNDERDGYRTRRKAGAATTVAGVTAAVILIVTPLPLAMHNYPLHHGQAVTQQSPARALGSVSGELPPHPERPAYWTASEPLNTSGTATTFTGIS